MKRLDDIPKKNIFEVPDDYFDRLALQIQSKTENTSSTNRPIVILNFTLRYVMPVVLAGVALVYLFKTKTVENTEELLASIPTEHLVAYLNESDINEQELLEAVKFDHEDADSLSVRVQTNFLLNEHEADEFESVIENEL